MARKKDKEKVEEPEYKEPSGTSYDDSSSSYGAETPTEGEILLQDGNEEGLLAQINVVENVNVEQDHDMNVSTFEFTGSLDIKNPSSEDRLWDIKVNFEDVSKTNLDSSEIYIRELGVDEDNSVDSREFAISGEAENLLLVKEFISTLPEAFESWDISKMEKVMLSDKGDADADDADVDADDADVDADELPLESYGVSINQVNQIQMRIVVRSLFEADVNEIKITKAIPSELQNVSVIDSSLGLADTEGDQIVWTIDVLEPEITAYITISAEIQVETKDPVKTGTVEVTYRAASSFTGGLSVEAFEAYARNRFTIDELERDSEPGVWDCSVLFENLSGFMIELYAADVHTADAEGTNLVEVDAENPLLLPAGAQWQSPGFEIQSEDYPSIRKEMNFRVKHEISTEVSGTLAIGDVDLVLASITGGIDFIIPEEIEDRPPGVEEVQDERGRVIKVPTYKETEIPTKLTVTNDGSAPLNELKWQQRYFDDEFQPPTADEIKCTWDGEEVPITDDMVTFEDNILKVDFGQLKDTDNGMFEADSTMEFEYPIHVVNPSEGSTFDSEVIVNANTYPRSQELEFIPEAEEIPILEAVHIRRKYRIGKEILSIGGLGEYQIVLHVLNLGNMPLRNIILMDKVPDAFERSNFSLEPEDIQDEKGEDIIKWEIENVEPDEEVTVTYDVKGSGDYNPSDAQLAY